MKISAFRCFVFVSCCTQALPAATVDFDTSGELQNNFNFVTSSGVNRYTQSSSGGVGNSGSVGFTAVSTDDTTAIYNQSSFDFSIPSTQLSISALFHVVPVSDSYIGFSAGFTLIEIGFSTENSTGFGHRIPGNAFMSLGLEPVTTTGDTFNMFYSTGSPSGGSSTAIFQTQIILTPGDFYKLTGTFLISSPSTYQVSGELDDYGTDGLSPGGTVFSFSNNNHGGAGTTLPSDSAVWGGFLSDSANGTDHLDMFAIQQVPEPSTWALLGLGVAWLVIFRRRR